MPAGVAVHRNWWPCAAFCAALLILGAGTAQAACPDFGVNVALTAGSAETPAVSTDYSLSGVTGTGYSFIGDPGVDISILNAAQITGDPVVPVIGVATTDGDICFEDTPAATYTVPGDGLFFAVDGSGNIDVTLRGDVIAPNGQVALVAGLMPGATAGNIVLRTFGNLVGDDAAILAVNFADLSGDIDIVTAAGTIIGVTGGFGGGVGIGASRLTFGQGPTVGNIRIDNSADVIVLGGGSTGIQATLCNCTTGTVAVVNRGAVFADLGIMAASSTTVSVQHLAGAITANIIGIAAGGEDINFNATVPVFITVAEGASITALFGIIAGDPFGGPPANPATIVVGGTIDSAGSAAISLANAAANRVEIHPSYQIMGGVDATPGGNDTLALGGAGSRTFDVSLLTTQFVGFETLEKSGSSAWTLTGTDPFVGNLNVLGGTLSLGTGASLPNADVNLAAGRLAGVGTVGNLIAGGTLAPGNSIGTITVAGTATFNAGSIYEVEVDPNASDLTTANAAVINGGTVAVVALPGNYAATQQYAIVATAAPNGLTGQFSGVTINTRFLTPTLSSDANNVYLTLNLNPAAGEIHASLLGAFVESDQLRIAALDRAGTESLTADASSFVAGGAAGGAEPEGLWGRLYGAGGTLLANGTAATLTHGEGGILAGTDAMLGAARLGVLAGYGQTRATVAAYNSTAGTHDLSAGLYGGGDVGPATLKFGAGYTHHLVSTTRTTGIPGVTDTFAATYAVGTAQAFAEADGRIDLGAQEIVPFAGIAALNSHHGAFSETGGVGAINVAAGSFGAVVTTVGVRLEHEFKTGDTGLATARASAAWRHGASGDPAITGSFAGSPAVVVTGTAPLRDALTVSAELDLDLTATWSLDLAYRGQFAIGGETHSATATLAASF